MLSFLIIDDEPTIIVTLESIISRAFPNAEVNTATNGSDGWAVLQAKSPSIVICDLQLPGMSGIDLCKKVRASEFLKETYFIIITASTVKEQRIEALEAGADDYLNKPLTTDDLTAKLRSAIRIVQMQERLRKENTKLVKVSEQLEQDFEEMVQLTVGFLQSRFAQTIPMLGRVTKTVQWISKQFSEFTEIERKELEYASQLCYVGKLFLPDSLMYYPISIDGKPSHELMNQVPHSAKMILTAVKRFENIGDILHKMHENFDGSGFPDRLQSWQIPMQARILRVVLDFEELRDRTRKTPQDAFAHIQRGAKRLYDNRVVLLLGEYISRNSGSLAQNTSRPVQLQDLMEGMILARDIYTNSGMKLLPAEATLSANTIDKILSHASTDPIIGNIYVKI
jgi:response regulator RpfG family c-di-GMP phosphodiesterase